MGYYILFPVEKEDMTRFGAHEGEEYGVFAALFLCLFEEDFVSSAVGERFCTFNDDSAKGGEAYAAYFSRARFQQRHTRSF